jgi:hypothetical protein
MAKTRANLESGLYRLVEVGDRVVVCSLAESGRRKGVAAAPHWPVLNWYDPCDLCARAEAICKDNGS